MALFGGGGTHEKVFLTMKIERKFFMYNSRNSTKISIFLTFTDNKSFRALFVVKYNIIYTKFHELFNFFVRHSFFFMWNLYFFVRY